MAAAPRKSAAPARRGAAGKCGRSASRRAERPSACGRARPRRWCPTRASSSCACAATGRSRRRPPTPCCRKATSWPSRALARCWSGCSGEGATEVEDRGAAGRAGRGRRRPGEQQGGRRQDPRRTGPDAGDARRLPAEDHARRDRDHDPHPGEHQGRARRPVHDRRPHAGHQRRHQAAGCRRSRDRRHRHGVRRRGDRDRRAVRLAGPQHQRRAADAVHGRRRARRRDHRRLATVRPPVASDASRRRPSGS